MREGSRLVVIETGEDNLERARLDGARTFIGNAADPDVLADADLKAARRLFVTIPEPFEAGQVVQQARVINPTLDILARAHTDAAVAHLAGLGASLVVLGEREIAERMIERARGEATS
jgi:CPA2 family monovalent cation:H+ antiporter-2